MHYHSSDLCNLQCKISKSLKHVVTWKKPKTSDPKDTNETMPSGHPKSFSHMFRPSYHHLFFLYDFSYTTSSSNSSHPFCFCFFSAGTMAASSALFAPIFSAVQKKNGIVAPSSISFHGLRPLSKGKSSSNAIPFTRNSAASARLAIKAELSAPVVISASTALSLFLGRFVFFNFQRENVAKQVPEQNGLTHFEAGDTRAKEYVSLLKSNDPVGFNIVDVLAWGSLGHIVAYYILATTSNGYDPKFFGWTTASSS